jgi:hypothetical protein
MGCSYPRATTRPELVDYHHDAERSQVDSTVLRTGGAGLELPIHPGHDSGIVSHDGLGVPRLPHLRRDVRRCHRFILDPHFRHVPRRFSGLSHNDYLWISLLTQPVEPPVIWHMELRIVDLLPVCMSRVSSVEGRSASPPRSIPQRNRYSFQSKR